MIIKDMKINSLIPYEKNPRKISDEAVDKVAASIEKFGFQQPIVVDTDRVVIVGHTRLKAAKKLGLKIVPVVIAENLTAEQANAYRLADNKTGEFSKWDDDLLLEELDSILNIDMSEFGFEFEDSEKNSEEEDRDEVNISEENKLIISCDSEKELENLFEEMTGRGYICSVSTF